MLRNTTGQVVVAQLVSRSDGTPVTSGTTNVFVLGDGGTQNAGAGSVVHKGEGVWSYFPTQAETNFSHIAFTFKHSSAVTTTVQLYTRNNDIAAIKAKTDNLPSNPAATTDIPTTTINAIKAKTDNLPSNPAATTDIPTATINSIKAKTDNLPSNPAATSDIPTASINAIKAKTDNLPSNPAATTDIPTASISAIKAKTDNLPSDPAATSDIPISTINAIKEKTDNLPAAPASISDIPTAPEIAAQVLDQANTELTSTPGATGTIRQMIQFIFSYFRSKRVVTATQETLYRSDGVTVVGTSSLNESGGTFTKGKMS